MDRKSFEILKGKNFFKNNKNQLFIIDYFVFDERIILKELLKFTDNFCVLLKQPQKLDSVSFRCFCNHQNVVKVLNGIFVNKKLICEYESVIIQENMHSIIFVKDDINIPSKFSDFLEKSLRFSYMITLLKNYKFDSFELYNNNCIVRLNSKEKQKKNRVDLVLDAREKTKILSMFGGIGDHFMLFSYMTEFINNERKKGNEIVLPVVKGDDKAEYFAMNFYSEEKRVNFSNEKMYEFCLFENTSTKVLSLFNTYWTKIQEVKYRDNLFHFTEVIKEILNIEDDISPYQHRDTLEKIILSALDEQEKTKIDTLLSNKYIGIQFFTGQQDCDGIWITDDKRNWDQDKVERFLEICNKEGFQLITFSACPYDMKGVVRLSGLSISGYAYAISKLDMVVGIDSSQGHIAAFWGIPSITLWGEQTPENFYGAKINYQPLRFNKSIFTHSKNISDIEPEFVVSKMREVKMSQKNIRYDCYEGNEIIIYEAERKNE